MKRPQSRPRFTPLAIYQWLFGKPTRSRAGSRVRAIPQLEVLEDRTVLSTITWQNRGDSMNDTDGFNAVFGANAATARNDVAAAIAAWQAVIANFNYSD